MPAARLNGVLCASAAAIIFSLSPALARVAVSEIPEGVVAGGRLCIGGLVVICVAVLRKEPFHFQQNWKLIAISGVCLGVHFLTYVAAIGRTTLAHAITLVYLSVPMIALLSWWFLSERLARWQWAGVGLAISGLALLTGFEPLATERMLFGDVFAVVCAITFALYSLAGRWRGSDMGLLAYAGSVYLTAAIITVPFATSSLFLTPFDPATVSGSAWLSVVASGLFPMAAGHTLYNAALRLTNATVVNLVSMQEVVLAVVLGALLFAEPLTLVTFLGVVLTFGGVMLVTAMARKPAA